MNIDINFPREEYACPNMNGCPCKEAQLETCDHVIYDCVRYNEVVGDTLTDIIGFLQGNPDAFCFQDNNVLLPWLVSM